MSTLLSQSRVLLGRGGRQLLVHRRGYADEMKLTFAAANKTFYADSIVRQIDVPSFSGSFGILAKHVPILGQSLLFLLFRWSYSIFSFYF